MKNTTKRRTVCLVASICAGGLASAVPHFHSDFDEATIGDITGLSIDTPNPNLGTGDSGTVTLNTGTSQLDLDANGANLWTAREGAPIAWVDAPTVAVGETWYVETQVNMVNDPGGVASGYDQAGITFYGGPDGANPGATDNFALLLNDWNNWGVQNAAFSVGGAANASNVALDPAVTGVFLRVEITEGGATDTYNFFYKEEEVDAWSQLGGVAIDRMGSFDNSRVGLVLKSHNNNPNGAAQFDYLTVDVIERPTWQVDASGDWSTPTNWSPAVPNAASAEAVFSETVPPITSPLTASLDMPVTLGDLSFLSAEAITIGGPSALTFDGGGAAFVSATAGSHVISAAVSLTDPLDVALSPGSALDVSGALSGTTSVTNSGDGQLTLSGDLSGHSGGIIADAGSLVVSGTSAGAMTANGGTLEVSGSGSGDITVNAGGTLSGEGSHAGTLNLAVGSILSVDPTNGAGAFTTGTLSPTAPVDLEFSSSPVGLTGFTVLNYTTYGGTVATDLVSSYRLTLTDDLAGTITGTVPAAATSNWTAADDAGGGFYYWDNGTSQNWDSSDMLFYAEDAVTFTDAGAIVSEFVDVAAEVAPATVTFTNTLGNNYTVEDATTNVETISAETGGLNVTGDGDVTLNVKLTGNTDITHSGAGVLTIGAGVGNDFVGDVAVNGGGTLVVGSNNFLGNTSNTVTIGSGSTLDLNGIGNGGNNFQGYDENTFILAGGATLTNSSSTVLNQAFSDQLQFGGNVTLSGNHRIDIFGNIDVTGTDITITLDYVQPVGTAIGSVINGDNSTESIALWLVEEGTLFVNNATSLGDSAVVRVREGGVLRGNGGNAGGDWITINDVFLEAGSQIQKRDQDNVFNLDGTVTVEGDSSIRPGGGGDTIALNGVLTGSGNLSYGNTGNLRLGTGFDDSTYTGDLVIASDGGVKVIDLADLEVGVAETTTLSPNVQVDEADANQFRLRVIGAEDTMTLTGDISGVGGVQIAGLGKVILSGTNTYSGGTTVSAGTLCITELSALPNGEDITVTGSGVLNLDFVGSTTVGKVTIDGVVQPLGTLDSSHPSGAITGGGSLNVTVTDAPPEITNGELDGSGNLILTISEAAAGLATQRMDDEATGTFADITSAFVSDTNEITIPAADVDPDGNGRELYRVVR